MKKYIPNKRITTQLYKWHISSYKWVLYTIDYNCMHIFKTCGYLGLKTSAH